MTTPSDLDSHSGDERDDTWHGIPRTIARPSAQELRAWLLNTLDVSAAAVEAADHDGALRAWFDPVARGARLRAALDRLPPVPEPPAHLEAPFIVNAGAGRRLATVEGRELCNLLSTALSTNAGTVRLRWEDTEAADALALRWYRDLATGRLQSVLRLRAGTAAPLLPQAVGLVLLLLINGNLGAHRGLQRPESPSDLQSVNEAVASMVGAFADKLVTSTKRSASAYSLYGGYAISEARRRLGSDLLVAPVALAEGSRDRVVQRLGEELVRRTKLNWPAVEVAFDELVRQYDGWRPRLAAYGLAQGRSTDSVLLRRDLRRAYEQAQERLDA